MGLPTPQDKVQTLQAALQAKAKAEPAFRFYSLWDKVCRMDVLTEAHRRCRANGGAPGVDGVTFKQIEAQGVDRWLAAVREALVRKTYAPQPLRRVWIAKADGGQRPLSIPTIRDRVVQMAMLLVLTPIFEPDLFDEQYGFRSGVDAKMALRRVYYHVTERKLDEVVDADLSDYFNTIPHGALVRCLSRRIADGQILSTTKRWLRVPVIERAGRSERRTTEAADTSRGTAQGGPLSPMLANLYFRRFILAWKKFGYEKKLGARIVNYADDLVICCPSGNGSRATDAMRHLMARLGLTVNERKTWIAKLPEDRFDFLGYTVGRFYGRAGKPYLGTRPSKKAVRRVMRRIHEETSSRWNEKSPQTRVVSINPILRGWCNYFDQGPVLREYRQIQHYTERRLRRWLMRRRQKRGTGYKQYSDAYLYEWLGLFKPPTSPSDMPKAKA